MKQLRYLLATLAMLIIIVWLSSCKKFLDQKPNQTIAVPATLTEARDLLNYYVVMNCSGPDIVMESDDDFYMPDALYNASTEAVKDAYTWQKNVFTDASWQYLYGVVLAANIALELTQEIAPDTRNQTEWNTVKGMALYHRSNAFYQLAQCYAKPYNVATAATLPGIPLRLSSDLNTPTTRATLQRTYDQLIGDLKTAIPLLPIATVPVSMPSRAAAYAMLARVCLAIENYPAALLYADSSLQINSSLLNFNTLSTTAAAPFAQFNTEVLFPSTLIGLARFSVNNLLVDSFMYQSYSTNDLRRSLFFKSLSPLAGYGFKGNYEGNTHGQLFTGLAVNEMYLIKAECQARETSYAHAMQTLNTLLITRWRTGTFTAYTAANNQEALEIILKERRKELVGRGIRWHDLRRYNQHPESAITLKRLVNGNSYLLPPGHPNYTFYIPQLVIDEAGIIQNTRQ